MTINSKCPACRKLIKGSCDQCKRSRLASQKKRYIRLKENKLCTTCGKPKTNHSPRCTKCLKAARNSKPKNNCTECDRQRDDFNFVKGKNLCKQCNSKRDHEYRSKVPKEHYLAKRHTYTQLNFTNWLRIRLISSKTSSKRRNLEHSIDLEYLLYLLNSQSERCAITGIMMVHKPDPRAASIDRIDSDLGYVRGNIQLVCKVINFAKNTCTNTEIICFLNEIK